MSKGISQVRFQLIDWNNRFPLDKAFRKKYNIPFASERHRELNQIDIYYEWLEDELYKEFVDKATEEIKKEQEFEKGNWLKDTEVDNKDELLLFEKLNVANINENSKIQIID